MILVANGHFRTVPENLELSLLCMLATFKSEKS